MSLPLKSGNFTVTTVGTIDGIPANGSRKGLILSNTGTQNVTGGSFHGDAIATKGFTLDAGQKVILQGLDTYKNELKMIVGASTTNISFEEI